MTNEEIFKKLEAFAENRRDNCWENGETLNTPYWVGYLDGLKWQKVQIRFSLVHTVLVTKIVKTVVALNVQKDGLNERLKNDGF